MAAAVVFAAILILAATVTMALADIAIAILTRK